MFLQEGRIGSCLLATYSTTTEDSHNMDWTFLQALHELACSHRVYILEWGQGHKQVNSNNEISGHVKGGLVRAPKLICG